MQSLGRSPETNFNLPNMDFFFKKQEGHASANYTPSDEERDIEVYWKGE
jgi:hypothetical protein